MKQGEGPNLLFCPRCRRLTKVAEWRPILRHVLAPNHSPAARVLEHTTCETMVYFLLE